MTRFVCLMTIWMVAVMAAGAAGPSGGDYGEPRLLIAAPRDPQLAHLSWPKIVATRDGTLVVAYSAGIGHNIGSSGPAVSISTDRGASFSRPHVLRRFPDDDDRYRDCGNMALGLAEDGAVVLLAMAYRGDQANTIVGWRSEDDGRTWAPVDTSALAENRTGSVYGHVFSVPERGLAVVGHYRAPSRPHAEGIWLAFSQDAGRTWGVPERIVAQRLFEPAVVFAENRFVGLIRDSSSAPPYWQLVGDETGWTLEPSAVRPDEPWAGLRAPSPFVTVDPDDPARLWALESQRFGSGRGGAIWLWTARADTLDWRRLGQVVQLPASDPDHTDFTYPWMAPLGEGRWFLVFYSGRNRGASSIYGMEIDLANAQADGR